jgi:hypothetical protein
LARLIANIVGDIIGTFVTLRLAGGLKADAFHPCAPTPGLEPISD